MAYVQLLGEAYVQLLGELPADRRREAARRQVAALAKQRAASGRARRAIAALLARDRVHDELVNRVESEPGGGYPAT
jgi:flagellar biosynthesis regulator FlaF